MRHPYPHPDSPTVTARPLNCSRRRLLLAGSALAGSALGLSEARAASGPAVQVWKSPTCGCCHDWIAHMEAHGFRVTAHDDGNTDARARAGLPVKYGSCHTAYVGGYAVEGHVPAADVQRLLKERPAAIGLAVPGMPIGSPGMDGPAYGGRRDAYQVLLVLRDGTARVWSDHPAA